MDSSSFFASSHSFTDIRGQQIQKRFGTGKTRRAGGMQMKDRFVLNGYAYDTKAEWEEAKKEEESICILVLQLLLRAVQR